MNRNVVILLAVLNVILLGLAGRSIWLSSRPFPTLVGYAQALFLDIKEGRLEDARKRMGKMYQEEHDLARMKIALDSIPIEWSKVKVVVENVTTTESFYTDAEVKGFLQIETDQVRFHASLYEDQDKDGNKGAWYVKSLIIAEQKLP